VSERSLLLFAYGTLTLCGTTFQNASAKQQVCNFSIDLVPDLSDPTTPNWQGHQALTPTRFRLIPFRSPLLRESLLLFFPQGTEMFQFPWFPLPALCVQAGVPQFMLWWVSPFGHPRINAWEATPRGLSQPPTSFIGSRRQGIHRWLFVAWKNKDARARYRILKGRTTNAAQRRRGSLRLAEVTRSKRGTCRPQELARKAQLESH
jgi:hypothetical protein